MTSPAPFAARRPEASPSRLVAVSVEGRCTVATSAPPPRTMPKAVPSTADAARASDNVTVCVVPLTWTIPAVRSEPPDTVSSRSEEHTSELQSLMRISYAVFCLKKKNTIQTKKLLTPEKDSKPFDKQIDTNNHKQHRHIKSTVIIS